MSDELHAEFNTSIRACRAALDKMINQLHKDIVGTAHKRLYFPQMDSKQAFLDAVANGTHGFGWASALDPKVLGVIGATQGKGPFLYLSRVHSIYRDCAHHGNIEARTADRFPSVFGNLMGTVDGVSTLGFTENRDYYGLPLAGARRHTSPLGRIVIGPHRDFVLTSTDESLPWALVSIHNATLRLYLRLAPLVGWDATPVSEMLVRLWTKLEPLE